MRQFGDSYALIREAQINYSQRYADGAAHLEERSTRLLVKRITHLESSKTVSDELHFCFPSFAR